MRNKAFEKLLKEAILLDAEEQGAHMDATNEPIPEAAQARFDAALNGTRKKSKITIDDMPSEQPQPVKRAHRWLAYGLTAVSAAAVVLVVALILGAGGIRATKAPEPADVQPPQAEVTSAPLPEPGEQLAPEAPVEPEPAETGEPLPYASATFADRNAASIAMKRFYEENRTLLMAVAEDMKAPEHGMIVNGVVYPIKDNGFVDRDHPYASMTDSIRAFLDLPDSGDYILSWDDESVFSVSLRWTNDSGYYSTELVFAEDGQRIVKMMYEKGGSTLEPVYEDSAWGVYTICWKKAPYYHDSSYALGLETGVWETDDYDYPSLYLELFDDGTARILGLFGDYDIRAHYAWNMTSRNIVLLTFSDQTIVRTAELNTDTDTMTLTLADGSTIEATRVSYRLIVEIRAEDLEGV